MDCRRLGDGWVEETRCVQPFRFERHVPPTSVVCRAPGILHKASNKDRVSMLCILNAHISAATASRRARWAGHARAARSVSAIVARADHRPGL